jgi:hypothetical protein
LPVAHHELQRVVEVRPFDTARDHDLADGNDRRRHPGHQLRIVGDEPEQLGIAKIVPPIAVGLDRALAQEVRMLAEQSAQGVRVAGVDQPDRRAKPLVADDRPVEQLGDERPVRRRTLAGIGERRPAAPIALPVERAMTDQEFD